MPELEPGLVPDEDFPIDGNGVEVPLPEPESREIVHFCGLNSMSPDAATRDRLPHEVSWRTGSEVAPWAGAPGDERHRERLVGEDYKTARRSLRAFAMTETELRLIAALAMIGERRRPKKG